MYTKDPSSDQILILPSPRMDGIKLQLFCCVRIELAIGSLPDPGKSGFPRVSPGSDWLIWIPKYKPCLDMRQNPSRDTHFPSYGRLPLPKPNNKTKCRCIFVLLDTKDTFRKTGCVGYVPSGHNRLRKIKQLYRTMASLGKIFPKTLKECIFSGIWQFLILMTLKDIKKIKKIEKGQRRSQRSF